MDEKLRDLFSVIGIVGIVVGAIYLLKPSRVEKWSADSPTTPAQIKALIKEPEFKALLIEIMKEIIPTPAPAPKPVIKFSKFSINKFPVIDMENLKAGFVCSPKTLSVMKFIPKTKTEGTYATFNTTRPAISPWQSDLDGKPAKTGDYYIKRDTLYMKVDGDNEIQMDIDTTVPGFKLKWDNNLFDHSSCLERIDTSQ